jgi:hypothetical protein
LQGEQKKHEYLNILNKIFILGCLYLEGLSKSTLPDFMICVKFTVQKCLIIWPRKSLINHRLIT